MLTDEELAELRRTLEECARLMAANSPSASEQQAAERMAAVSEDATDLAA
jgi:hypothetical protein